MDGEGVDDDDDVPDDYCYTLWKILNNCPDIDCIGFDQDCKFSNRKPCIASLSNRWESWQDNIGGYGHLRTPFFPNPIRREHIMKIGYKDMRFGEDYDFSLRLKQSGLIQKEIYLHQIMYYYQYTHGTHKEKYGI